MNNIENQHLWVGFCFVWEVPVCGWPLHIDRLNICFQACAVAPMDCTFGWGEGGTLLPWSCDQHLKEEHDANRSGRARHVAKLWFLQMRDGDLGVPAWGHEWCPCPIAERKVWVPAVMKQRIIPLRLKDKPCFVAWPGSVPHMVDSLGHAVTLLPSGHCWDSFSSYIFLFSSSASLKLFFNQRSRWGFSSSRSKWNFALRKKEADQFRKFLLQWLKHPEKEL